MQLGWRVRLVVLLVILEIVVVIVPACARGGTGESNGVANCRGFGARRNGAQCLLDAVGKALERGARDGGCLHLSGGALACPRGVADPEKVHPHGPATNESPVDASTLSIAAFDPADPNPRNHLR